MTFESAIQTVLEFVREHEAWAPVIVFVLALLESIVGLSLAVPSTPIFVGVGALIGVSDIAFWPIFAGVALGGFVGDWVSYALGRHFKDPVLNWKPVRDRPQVIARTETILRNWGMAAIFVCRFISPIRSFVPFVAGMFQMPFWMFQIANASSAVVWAYVLLAPGASLLRGYGLA